jgi:hypothetical protein
VHREKKRKRRRCKERIMRILDERERERGERVLDAVGNHKWTGT